MGSVKPYPIKATEIEKPRHEGGARSTCYTLTRPKAIATNVKVMPIAAVRPAIRLTVNTTSGISHSPEYTTSELSVSCVTDEVRPGNA